MLTLPTDDVTIEQAAWLLADAKHPGADEKTRGHNFRWMLNGLLAAVSNGTLRGRIPATGEGIDREGIDVHDYARIMVLTPRDIRKLADERDIEFQTVAPETDDKPAATGTVKQNRQRRDLLTPKIEEAQSEAKNPGDASEVFSILRRMATAKEQPFIGISTTGLKWNNASDAPKETSIDAVRKRIKPRSAKRR